ncbi:nitrate- and nitrite sensing domain-containing protein [Nisaea acidiphila]|uniref:Nitrate- and nitrite sensing domain-containing protein n=1 Tax=Nisaea acidiphila TaxID=1862145 RepID=A0A9J7AWW8_9PROT|nr:nitrate- and nitrite sensing domain-containing protein [Nisaea acidiphila]UUX51614.1 nitrate- and nitrite sensing domain-containing protein [Nisaea acidiphila]
MRISLRKELIFLVVLPHFAILSLAASAIITQLDRTAKLERLAPLTELSIAASGLIHELQKERGLTVGLITSGFAEKNAKAVAAQRQLTDPALEQFREREAEFKADVIAVDASYDDTARLLKDVDTALARLEDHRSRADGAALKVPENVGYYTGIIDDLITLTVLSTEHSPSQEITALMLPYVAMIEAKENGGLERAIGAALLNRAAQGEFDRKQYEIYFGRLVGERNALAHFRQSASPALREVFASTMTPAAEAAVADGRAIIAQLPDTVDPKGLAGSDWFATATKRLNLFKQVEDHIAEEIRAETQHQLALAEREIYRIVLVNGVIVLIFISFGLWRALPISSRISKIVDALSRLSKGDESVSLPEDKRQDDLGDMARALVVFKKQMEDRARLEAEQRDAELKATEERTQSLRRMADAVEGELQDRVDGIASEGERLSSDAGALSGISSNVSENAQAVASAAEEATSNAASVSEFASQINASLADVVAQVEDAKRAAQGAQEVAEKTNAVVTRLQEAASEVGTVSTLISDIAEQTNLLALNATIEAARAGDAGKGFAVVASEVKNLANQTQSSAANITDQIAGIQGIATDAVAAIGEIAGAIEKISASAGAIESAVDEQAAAVNEIAEGAAQSSAGSQEVTRRMVDVTQSIDQLDNFSKNLAELSSSLQEELGGLNSAIKRIIRTSTPEVDLRKENVPVAVDRRKG